MLGGRHSRGCCTWTGRASRSNAKPSLIVPENERSRPTSSSKSLDLCLFTITHFEVLPMSDRPAWPRAQPGTRLLTNFLHPDRQRRPVRRACQERRLSWPPARSLPRARRSTSGWLAPATTAFAVNAEQVDDLGDAIEHRSAGPAAEGPRHDRQRGDHRQLYPTARVQADRCQSLEKECALHVWPVVPRLRARAPAASWSSSAATRARAARPRRSTPSCLSTAADIARQKAAGNDVTGPEGRTARCR